VAVADMAADAAATVVVAVDVAAVAADAAGIVVAIAATVATAGKQKLGT
jgi:hypothetical protein